MQSKEEFKELKCKLPKTIFFSYRLLMRCIFHHLSWTDLTIFQLCRFCISKGFLFQII